jgi:hypothetical protein
VVPTVFSAESPVDATVLDGSEFQGTYHYDEAILTSTGEATFTENSTIYASELEINGDLLGEDAEAPGEDAPGIEMYAEDALTINGRIVAGSGGNGDDIEAYADTVEATDGGNGGYLHIKLNHTDSTLEVGTLAYLEAGPGGAGGTAEALGNNGTSANVTAIGGDGGHGGSLGINATNSALNGTLRLGSSGDGGHAVADREQRNTSAVGGDGGKVGALGTPEDVDPETLYEDDQLEGGNPGSGGHGWAYSHSGEDGDDDSASGDPGSDGEDGISPSSLGDLGDEHGGDAADGAGAKAVAGDAKPHCMVLLDWIKTGWYACVALDGGDGGNATALGGAGGDGGDGAAGVTDAEDQPIHGGDGGQGGEGGDAIAKAGDHTCGQIGGDGSGGDDQDSHEIPSTCGEQGDAYAEAHGGDGGDGGSAGWGQVLTEDIDSFCRNAESEEQDQFCWEPAVDDGATVCGHGGYGGSGGDAYAYADAEETDGDATGDETEIGDDGANGQPGAAAPHDDCDHDVDHSHVSS